VCSLLIYATKPFGVTSVIDAGGGFQHYPDDYAVFSALAREGELTVRTAYNLFTQRPTQEREDFATWVTMTKPGEGDDFYRVNGTGEMLVFSAADFEDFLQPRPELPMSMESELYEADRAAQARVHAFYRGPTSPMVSHLISAYAAREPL